MINTTKNLFDIPTDLYIYALPTTTVLDTSVRGESATARGYMYMDDGISVNDTSLARFDIFMHLTSDSTGNLTINHDIMGVRRNYTEENLGKIHYYRASVNMFNLTNTIQVKMVGVADLVTVDTAPTYDATTDMLTVDVMVGKKQVSVFDVEYITFAKV
jgi:hypothetical protein